MQFRLKLYLTGVPAPRPRLTTDEAFDESWAVMLKALSRALKPTYGSPFRDSPSPREMSEADPAVLSHKLDKKRRQLRRAVAHTKALASADYYLLVEDYLRAARSNRPKQSQKALWHRVTDYLKVSSTSLSIVVLVRAASLGR